jgi:flagellar biogenesis protein FliO
MVELCRGWNARWHAACAGALLALLLCASAGAQSTLAIADEEGTTVPAAAASPLLSYRRDDPANNPLRPAVVPAGAMELSPEDLADQAGATAAFAPVEPPISTDAPATPLVAAEPIPHASPAASAPFTAAAPSATLPPSHVLDSTTPPAAVAEDYATGPTYPYDAGSEAGPPRPIGAGPPQLMVDEAEHSAPSVTPTFTLPASASEAMPRGYEADAHATPDAAASRRLAPASGAASYRSGAATKSTLVPTAFGQLKSLASAGGALLLVVALFVACALLLRRRGPKPTGALPAEAFAVLGRAPLTAQSFAQLLRLGNKLVLVAVTADGAQPLAELDDPAEVDRIAGLCLSGRGGPSAEFQQVLAQLSREPAKGFLGREGSTARRRA